MTKLLLGLALLAAMAIPAVASAGYASDVKFVTPKSGATTSPSASATSSTSQGTPLSMSDRQCGS
jgi:hypothetical protein